MLNGYISPIGLDGRLTKEILSDGSYWETAYNDRERTISRIRKGDILSSDLPPTDIFQHKSKDRWMPPPPSLFRSNLNMLLLDILYNDRMDAVFNCP